MDTKQNEKKKLTLADGLDTYSMSLSEDAKNKMRQNPKYTITLMRLITKSLELALQPPLDEEQLLMTATTWQLVLEPIIGINELDKTFNNALKNHKTSFAINAHDLIRNQAKADGFRH